MSIKKYFIDKRITVSNKPGDFKDSFDLSSYVTTVTTNQDSVYFKSSSSDGKGMIYQNGTRVFSTVGGNNNIYLGKSAGTLNSSGGFGSNIGIGTEALSSLDSAGNAGHLNVAIGTFNLQYLTTGDSNTAVGAQSSRNLTTGSNNTAVGDGSLYAPSNATGSNNVAIGKSVLYSATSANKNTAVGAEAGVGSTTAASNVFVGYRSGYSVTTGTANVFLVHEAGKGFNGSNRLIIENSDNITTPLIDGDFSANTLKFNVSKLTLVGLPTSASGLTAGDVWNDGGVLTIV